MQQIKCPNCGEVFMVDESGYAQIVQQVRDKEFDKEINQREKDFEEMKEKDLELAKMKQKEEFDKLLSSKEAELVDKDKLIEQLKTQVYGNETEKQLAISEAINKKEKERELVVEKKNDELVDKDRMIAQLKAQIENNENERKLAVSEAVSGKEKEISKKVEEITALKEKFSIEDREKDKVIEQLKAKMSGSETEKQLAVSEAVNKKDKEKQEVLERKSEELTEKNRIIEELKVKLGTSETEKKLAVSEAVQEKEKELSQKLTEITKLKSQLSNKDTENQLKEQSLQREYEDKLKSKDELIEYYKDFKARQTTKMIGESLEQHCLNQFNSLRMTAFPTAYFEKDNDTKTGSKGDFIFREAAEGIEFISIMFEMKNEMDETATKHKNEDFFKELDRDRHEKGCEYAVLVSLLEINNELYNNGIVDVSYRYEKMYVIRPQFFIPLITLLRNAALNSLKYRQELEMAKHQQIDILHFEDNMNAFKEGFARNYRIASDKFKTAIDEIDKTISHLQKTREALLSSENQLRLANNKAEDLSIKKLTKNAHSVKEMFDEIKNEDVIS
ncbi:MAG: DUF2130 domain-containing protein [Eubacterium sp.]|nr:DUF2130 domain-containing protein [Eubacterium sp.]